MPSKPVPNEKMLVGSGVARETGHTGRYAAIWHFLADLAAISFYD
jgi:hypothetical protein